MSGAAEFSVGSGENCSKLGATDSHSEMEGENLEWGGEDETSVLPVVSHSRSLDICDV